MLEATMVLGSISTEYWQIGLFGLPVDAPAPNYSTASAAKGPRTHASDPTAGHNFDPTHYSADLSPAPLSAQKTSTASLVLSFVSLTNLLMSLNPSPFASPTSSNSMPSLVVTTAPSLANLANAIPRSPRLQDETPSART